MNTVTFHKIMSLLFEVGEIKKEMAQPNTDTIIKKMRDERLQKKKNKLEDEIYTLVMNNDCACN